MVFFKITFDKSQGYIKSITSIRSKADAVQAYSEWSLDRIEKVRWDYETGTWTASALFLIEVMVLVG